MAHLLHDFDGWRDDHAQLCFLGLVASGSLLMGSSIAYPILSQDGSTWASVALAIFFPSAGLFNTLQAPEIYLYGHYTLISCIISAVLVMAFGHTGPLPDHAKFIPVYAMASALLTAAWPSLFQSVGLPLRNMDGMTHGSAQWQNYLPVPMAEVVVDRDYTRQVGVAGLESASSGSLVPAWISQERDRQSASPSTALEQQAPSTQSFSMEPTQPSRVVQSDDLIHMGPSSAYSGGASSLGGASISLSAGHGRCPSEMSSIVAAHFFPEVRHVRRISARFVSQPFLPMSRRSRAAELPLFHDDELLDQPGLGIPRGALSV